MMYTLRNQCMLCAIHVYAEKSVNTINTMRLLLKKFTIFLLQSACLIAQARSNGAETGKTAKYLGFEPYWGWSNQILELKAMAAMAKATGRILVVPKFALGRKYMNSSSSYQLNVKDCKYAAYDSYETECVLFENLIDLERLSEFVPLIKEADFLTQNGISSFEQFLSYEKVHFGVDFSNVTTRMSHRVKWVDEHLDYDYNPKKEIKDTGKKDERPKWCFRGVLSGKTCLRSIHEIESNNKMLLVFPEYHSFGIARIRSKSRGKQYKFDNDVHRFVAPAQLILNISRAIRKKFPSDYIALHLRRGDFLTEGWAKKHVADIEKLAISLYDDPAIGKQRFIYISTDEIDDKVLGPLGVLNVTFLHDFFNVTKSGSLGRFWNTNISIPNKQLVRSYLEQVICVGAKTFIPQVASTFSRYIEMVRKNQWVYTRHGFSVESFRNKVKYEGLNGDIKTNTKLGNEEPRRSAVKVDQKVDKEEL